MPVQIKMPEVISTEESEALARFVHDLESRMETVAELLSDRGTPHTADLAGNITRDLRRLEDLLSARGRRFSQTEAEAYLPAR